MVTIFTPAYNRAGILPRLYQSLLAQTAMDFEWLVIDDGSTDETRKVVGGWIKEGRLPIRYIKKENGGKHTAHNEALRHANGEWLFCVDSDDWLPQNAVEDILEGSASVRPSDAGLVGYKADQNGRSLCAALDAQEQSHYGLYSLMRRGGGRGEYALVFRTELLRNFPFPEIPEERFMTEAVLYDRLELAGYTICPIGKVLTVCEYQPDGLSSDPYRLLLTAPGGYQIYHAQRIDLAVSWKERLGHCVRYQAFRRMSGNREYMYHGKHGLLTALAWLPGAAGALYYKSKRKR